MHAIMLLATAAFTIAPADPAERDTPPIGSTATFTVTDVSKDPTAAGQYLKVVSSIDVDGDGRADDGVLRITCAEDKLVSSSYRAGKAQPDKPKEQERVGKHSPKLMLKWNAATAELKAMKMRYDVKTNVKGRVGEASQQDDWTEVALSGAGKLCNAAARASNLNSSKSNVN